jgi:hypothetical protein
MIIICFSLLSCVCTRLSDLFYSFGLERTLGHVRICKLGFRQHHRFA